MVIRRLLTALVLIAMLAGLTLAPGGASPRTALAQADPCAGLAAWSQQYLTEEQRYADELATVLDTSDLRAIASATPQQLSLVVETIETHLKNLDTIDPPAFAADWQRANAESLDLAQALFADGALNGVFTVLVDYFDQSLAPIAKLRRRAWMPRPLVPISMRSLPTSISWTASWTTRCPDLRPGRAARDWTISGSRWSARTCRHWCRFRCPGTAGRVWHRLGCRSVDRLDPVAVPVAWPTTTKPWRSFWKRRRRRSMPLPGCRIRSISTGRWRHRSRSVRAGRHHGGQLRQRQHHYHGH